MLSHDDPDWPKERHLDSSWCQSGFTQRKLILEPNLVHLVVRLETRARMTWNTHQMGSYKTEILTQHYYHHCSSNTRIDWYRIIAKIEAMVLCSHFPMAMRNGSEMVWIKVNLHHFTPSGGAMAMEIIQNGSRTKMALQHENPPNSSCDSCPQP